MPSLRRVREGNAVNAVRLPASEASKETSSLSAAAAIDPCRNTGAHGNGGNGSVDGASASHSALSECVTRTIRRYLADIGDTLCDEGLHALVIREVEGPLLREVLAFHDGNQSRADSVLGINRATLRKKLAAHGLL
jgi:Fis family transcriptional regulator